MAGGGPEKMERPDRLTDRLPASLRGWVRALVRVVFSLRGALLIVFLMAAAAGLTAIHLGRRARLEERLEREYQRAEDLYRRGDFPAARSAYERVLELAQGLGRLRYSLAGAKGRYEACRAIMDLLPISLEELARQAYSTPSPGEWQAVFEREYRGRTVIFHTRLETVPDSAGAGLRVGYQVREPGGRRLELEFGRCRIFAGKGWRRGMKVLFSAALDRMTCDSGAPGRWRLHFAPGRCVLILDGRLLAAAGFEPDEGVRETIDEQRRLARRAGGVPVP